ncbi:MAG: NTP transferase domain-containing protein, partial [Oscillospiraceae bacterium]|nr:NTP transferase domain-containing protein [Oscillospiraceae bacterium]
MKKTMILLAAGASRRFGGENKLLYELGGLPLYRHTLDKLIRLTDAETAL